MSTSISFFVEYLPSRTPEVVAWNEPAGSIPVVLSHQIASLSHCSLEFGQPYNIFGALAGVRSDRSPLYTPRGIPKVISHMVGVHIFEPRVEPLDNLLPPIRKNTIFAHYPTSPDYAPLIASADMHNCGWLNYAELIESLDCSGIGISATPVAFRAVLAAMRELNDSLGKDRVRSVFWFTG